MHLRRKTLKVIHVRLTLSYNIQHDIKELFVQFLHFTCPVKSNLLFTIEAASMSVHKTTRDPGY